ncbi:hypothetical protein VZG28_08730 [Synechococcus elongatus IITB4]|uniref:PilW family protein n=1 Tax=Synechococcus elongatus TaxID=32046 RepID=UPI0030D38516
MTLAELLVASIVGILVVLGGGYLLSTNLQVDRELADSSIQRNLQARALEYIANEVRQASSISNQANPPTGADPITTPACTGVVALRLQTLVGGSLQSIVYRVDIAPADWRGPRIIRRCGPAIGNDGRYVTNPSNPPVNQVFLDGVSTDTLTAPACVNPINSYGNISGINDRESVSTAGMRTYLSNGITPPRSVQIYLGLPLERRIAATNLSCADIIATIRS